MNTLQYVSDEQGTPTAVIVPIELWRELTTEHETLYLLKSDAMKNRLFQARQRHEGITLETAREMLATPMDQWATARQIQATLRNTGRVFSDSTELTRESRDELENRE
jgi:hypothetical protein